MSIHRMSPWTARPNCLTFGIKRSYCLDVVTVLRLQTARGGTVDLRARRGCVYSCKPLSGISVSLLPVNKNKPTGTKTPFVLRMRPVSPVVPGRAEVCAVHLRRPSAQRKPWKLWKPWKPLPSSTCELRLGDARRYVGELAGKTTAELKMCECGGCLGNRALGVSGVPQPSCLSPRVRLKEVPPF